MNYEQLKEDNAIKNKVCIALADIRITRLTSLISSYNNKQLTASEFLELTDNLLQDELKQSIGR